MAAERHWQTDLASLSDHFWFPFRSALRKDLHASMDLVGLTNLSFAQRLESIDRRQLAQFSSCLGQMPVLDITESSVLAVFNEEPSLLERISTSGATKPTWLGLLTVHYMQLCRSALIDSYPLAFEQFRLRDPGFARLLVSTPLGSLMRLAPATNSTSFLTLEVSVAMETLLDRVIDGVEGEDLAVCRAAHFMSTRRPAGSLVVSAHL